MFRLLVPFDLRLGSRGAAEIKSHPWFARTSWGRLWTGELFTPTILKLRFLI